MSGNGNGWAVLPSAVAAFWTYVVLDFALHAVVMASWWRDHGTFSLSLLELAQRIPIGYASFAMYCVGLCYLLARRRSGGPGLLVGVRVGALAGFAYGTMFGLGIYSIARIPASFLVLGPASTAVCSAGAGGAGAWVLGGRRWRRVGLVVLGGVVVLILAVVAQNMLQIYPAESPVRQP